MRLHRVFLAVVVVSCVIGCREPRGAAVDAGACDRARTVQCVIGPFTAQACAGEPIEVGTFCDDLFACATDAAAAQALVEAAPGFTCTPGPGELGLCDAGEHSCQWREPGTIDAAALEQVCAVTVLPTPPPQVMCIVYVRNLGRIDDERPTRSLAAG
jgi:hypothetical protein